MDEQAPPSAPPGEPAGMTPPPPPVVSSAPPVITPPPLAPRPRAGRGWMLLSIALMVLLAAICLRFVAHSFLAVLSSARGGSSRHNLQEVVEEEADSNNKILVIDIDGIISGDIIDGTGHNMVAAIKERLKMAALDSDVKAVLLKVDSPGGEVLAADDIAREIAAFQKDTLKPVIATMGSMAASGGYYISAPCRWIVANELTITGSIGVIMHGWNYRALMDKVGIKPQVYKSGKFKDMLSGEKSPEEILPEENTMVQSLIDQTYARFTNVVATGRAAAQKMNMSKGQPLARNWPQYADGRILSGRDAQQYGFVDELGNFDTAVERAKLMTGISSASLIRYQQPFELSNLLRFFAKSDAKNLKIEFGPELPKLRMGRLYFLMP